MVRAPLAHHAGTGPPGQDKPTSPWAIDRSLSVSPQSAAGAGAEVRLLPLNSELKEGNAVPIYLRLVHEQNDATRKYWTETPKTVERDARRQNSVR